MRVLLVQNKLIKDITSLTLNKTLGGSKTQAPRSLDFQFIRLPDTDINLGDHIIFYNNKNVELFQGMVFSRDINEDGFRKIVAYDVMFYWANNKDTFTFTNRTADEMFSQICSTFQIPKGTVHKSYYKIPKQECPDRCLYDIILKAMSTTYKHTGRRYYTRSKNGKVEFLQRSQQTHQWVLEVGVNILNYSLSESIENMITKVKLISDKNQVVISQDNDLIKKFGLLQLTEKPQGKLNLAQLTQKSKSLLRNKSKVEKTLDINGLGIDGIISGDAIFVYIPELKVKRAYYVESDRHNYDDNEHTMSLKLLETDEIIGGD